MFLRPEVVIQEHALRRRVLRFFLDDRYAMVLDYDADEHRETNRHKWRVQRQWIRNNTMERRPVPQAAIDSALQQIFDSISYQESEWTRKRRKKRSRS